MDMNLTAEEARRIFDYNPETGKLVWKIRIHPNSRAKPGSTAGCVKHNPTTGKSYRYVKLRQEKCMAHRLVWLIVTGEWPVNQIDHINGNGLDNTWVNLRDVTAQQNGQNARRRVDNKTGVTGVFWDKSRKHFIVCIRVAKKVRNFGRFETFEEAVAVRKAAEIEHGYHPNHGQDRPL
jgi:hypothetical protein